MTIETRRLGRTGADVTILGYGAMELRGQPHGPAISDDDAGRLLGEVLDGGINLIDTSIDYGRSEELIGRYLGHRRDDYFLASKCGCLLGPSPPGARPPFPHDYSAANVRAGIEQSLRRLGTDHLDLVQVHMSPSREQMAAEDTIETLASVRAEGKTRFIGMSGILPNLPDHIAMGVFDVFQIPYSAVEREHEAIIAAAAKAGSGIVVRGGAAKGAPTEGKHEGVQWERWQKIDLRDLLAGSTPMEFILRFTFTHPDLHTNIVGTINPEHLRHNVDVLRQGPLRADVYAEAKRRLDAAGSSPRAA